jgi:hypothetical protein
MKYLSLFFVLMFTAFAALQYNDPDPILWMGFYLYAAMISGMAFFNKFNVYSIGIGIVVYITGIIYSWPETFSRITNEMNQADPNVELARETLGLTICLATMVMFLIYMYAKKEAEKEETTYQTKKNKRFAA